MITTLIVIAVITTLINIFIFLTTTINELKNKKKEKNKILDIQVFKDTDGLFNCKTSVNFDSKEESVEVIDFALDELNVTTQECLIKINKADLLKSRIEEIENKLDYANEMCFVETYNLMQELGKLRSQLEKI